MKLIESVKKTAIKMQPDFSWYNRGCALFTRSWEDSMGNLTTRICYNDNIWVTTIPHKTQVRGFVLATVLEFNIVS